MKNETVLSLLKEIRDLLKEQNRVEITGIDVTPKISIGENGHIHVHESDSLSYTSYPPQSKCKICGKFYR